jgi:protein-S-isoprenylcysteine O-methyltransferase Ste14
MNPSWQSYALLSAQLAALVYLLLSGPIFVRIDKPYWLALEISGAVLGGWSIAVLRLRNLHALPDVAANAQLVTKGPYRWVRHPIYFALLLTFGGVLGNHCTTTRMLAFIGLIVVLDLKCRYEERLLAQRFPAYRDYQQNTKRLIPFLY